MTRIYRARERKVSKTAKELGEQFHQAAFKKQDDLRNALSQIIEKVGESRSETRRLNWIAGRAQAALDGTEWPATVCAMPEPKNGKPKAERLAAENKALQELLNERDGRIDRLEADAERWQFVVALGHDLEFAKAADPVVTNADKYPETAEGIAQCISDSIAACKAAGIWPIATKQCGACAGCTNGCRVDAESPTPHDYRTDLQAWWGLSYASWLTIPRVLMEAMPKEWQAGMAALLHDYGDAIKNPPDLGVTVRTTHNGKLVAAPDWLNNYRHPDRAAIAHVFGKEGPAQ